MQTSPITCSIAQAQKTLATIWHVPDELWKKLSSILAEYHVSKPIGHKRIDARAALTLLLKKKPQISRKAQ
ncbi:hypothetical protein [Brasilonema bromeliae]|uniref:Transposase n=1 Tax=Brasilonema bromeliae SPC951 TaxID=385972 RepID=A0ABX1P7A2_9CYAN|nr:hypothetical protein [Brasilonema bromeliae]NMG20292.1 hypothetical protein [Brasilonema bromeliae SPC951]